MAYNIKVNPDKLDDFSEFVDNFAPNISTECEALRSSVASLSSVTDSESMGDIASTVAQIIAILEGVEPDLRQLSSGVKSYAEGVRQARSAMG